MEDIEKSYTLEELMLLTISVFYPLKELIFSRIDAYFSEDEKKALKEANEIINMPYEYRMNPDSFDMDKQEGAIDREVEINLILKKAESIKEKMVDDMPPNMKTTFFTLLQYDARKINKYEEQEW